MAKEIKDGGLVPNPEHDDLQATTMSGLAGVEEDGHFKAMKSSAVDRLLDQREKLLSMLGDMDFSHMNYVVAQTSLEKQISDLDRLLDHVMNRQPL